MQPGLLALTALNVTFAGSLLAQAYPPDVGIGAAFLLAIADPRHLLPGVPFAACLLAILGTHEMGHYLACRWYGIPASLPYFIPGVPPFGTFGAVIRIRGRIPNRRALFDVAAAGPLAGFAVALPVLVAGLFSSAPLPEEPAAGEAWVGLGTPPLVRVLVAALHPPLDGPLGPIYVAGWFGLLVTSMNLFPVGQLDGGHAVYALSRRMHRVLAWACIVVMVALVVMQTVWYLLPSFWTLWCVVLLVLRDRHPPVVDEGVPLGAVRHVLLALLAVVFLLSFIPVPFHFL